MARWTANSPRIRGILAGVALTVCLGVPTARADGETKAARAQALFEEAHALMKQHEYSAACLKLGESQALDPGGGTLLNLGICHAREGRTATAFAELKLAISQAKSDGRADRERTAQKHLDDLTFVLNHLTLVVSAGASSQGLVIELDGTALDPTLLGLAFPIDPGRHQIRASQAGHRPWTGEVTAGPQSDQQNLEIPPLELEHPSPIEPALVNPSFNQTPPSAEPPKSTNPSRPIPAPPATHPPADTSTPRWLGIASLGVGAVALGVGTYFGVRTITLKGDSNQDYNGSTCTQKSCADDWARARTASVYSDVGFGIGLVALGVGTYLVLAPAKHPRAARGPRLFWAGTRSGAALSLRTEF